MKTKISTDFQSCISARLKILPYSQENTCVGVYFWSLIFPEEILNGKLYFLCSDACNNFFAIHVTHAVIQYTVCKIQSLHTNKDHAGIRPFYTSIQRSYIDKNQYSIIITALTFDKNWSLSLNSKESLSYIVETLHMYETWVRVFLILHPSSN